MSTHYVVNGFEVVLPFANDVASGDLPDEQHGDYRWFGEGELMASDEVHVHSKWYFDGGKGFL